MRNWIAFGSLVLILIALNIQAIFINGKDVAENTDQENKQEVLSGQKQASSRKPASVTKPPKAEVSASKEKRSLGKLASLKKCFQSKDCPFPDTDARSYHIEVSRAISKELSVIYNKVTSKNIISERVSSLAREYIQFDDGHIKEKCLELLSTQETNLENLNSILNNALSYHSDRLITPAMMEIRRYRNQGFDHIIEEYLEKLIMTSSPAVREKLTGQMADFINENNFDKFTELLNKLPRSSNSYAYLKSALDRFRYR